MMRTAIFTTEKTALTIESIEKLQLVQMSSAAQTAAPPPITLGAGTNKVVVGAGVFKVLSTKVVTVTAEPQSGQLLSTANDKDGDWPDPQMSNVTSGVSLAALRTFFATGAKSL